MAARLSSNDVTGPCIAHVCWPVNSVGIATLGT